jgi:hypothetical protein
MNKMTIFIFSIVTFFVIIVGLKLFSIISSVVASDIETPKYEVLKKYPKFELRKYEPMLLVTTDLGVASYDEKSGQGFRTIASYIFGNNKTNEKIAMTAPVIYHMDSTASFSFVAPSSNAKGRMPEPIDSVIKFEKQEIKLFAVFTFGGFINDKKMDKRMNELKQAVLKEGLQIKGGGYFFGYNPPWQLIGRKNEVAFEIESVN